MIALTVTLTLCVVLVYQKEADSTTQELCDVMSCIVQKGICGEQAFTCYYSKLTFRLTLDDKEYGGEDMQIFDLNEYAELYCQKFVANTTVTCYYSSGSLSLYPKSMGSAVSVVIVFTILDFVASIVAGISLYYVRFSE